MVTVKIEVVHAHGELEIIETVDVHTIKVADVCREIERTAERAVARAKCAINPDKQP